jgi:hypothetical protein
LLTFDKPALPLGCAPNVIAALVLLAVSAVSVVVGFTGLGVGVGEGVGVGLGVGVGVGVGVGDDVGVVVVDPAPAAAAVGVDVKLDAVPPPHPVTSAKENRAHKQKQIREVRLKPRLPKRSEVIDSRYSTHLG